jgi:hypothetical protein
MFIETMNEEHKRLLDIELEDSFNLVKSVNQYKDIDLLTAVGHNYADEFKNLISFGGENIKFCSECLVGIKIIKHKDYTEGFGCIEYIIYNTNAWFPTFQAIGFVQGSFFTNGKKNVLNYEKPCKIMFFDKKTTNLNHYKQEDYITVTPVITFIGTPNGVGKIIFYDGTEIRSDFHNFKPKPNAHYIKTMKNGEVKYGKCDNDGKFNESSEKPSKASGSKASGSNASNQQSPRKFTVNQQIKVNNISGKIEIINTDGTYNILYDDGTKDTNINENNINENNINENNINENTDKPKVSENLLSKYGTPAALGIGAAALGLGAYHLVKSKKKRKSKNSSPSKKQKRSSNKRSSRHRSRGRK